VNSAGKGYVEGTLRFASDDQPGSGFLGRFKPIMLNFSVSGATYQYVGGNITCVKGLYACLEIESEGNSYPISTSKSFEIAEFGDGLDPQCPEKRCDPIEKEVNCVISSNPFCWHHRIDRSIDIYFSEGCSVDDTNCVNVMQARAITSVSVLPWGHSHGCFDSSRITGVDGGGSGFAATYDVDYNTGQIAKAYFLTADDHGNNYVSEPVIKVEDAQCRCGTTVTDIGISVGGTGKLITDYFQPLPKLEFICFMTAVNPAQKIMLDFMRTDHIFAAYSSGLLRVDDRGGTGQGFLAIATSSGNITDIPIINGKSNLSL
jgi:hypothetical protein